MPEMITRELYQSPMQAYGLTENLRVDMGETLKNVWQTPQLSGLVENSIEQYGAGQYQTPEERQQITDLGAERVDLLRSIPTTSGEERDAIARRVQEIESQINIQKSRAAESAIKDGRLVGPEALNEAYGDLVTFDAPATPEQARLIYEGRKAEVIRDAIIERGPEGFVASAAKFGVGFLDVATDPLELAIGLIPVVGPTSRGARLTARLGRGAAEGLVAGAVTEPLYYALSRQQQLDYTMNDALLNVGLGAVLGGALSGVFGKRAAIADDVVDIVPDPTIREAVNVSLRQFVNDQPIDLSRLAVDLRYTTTLSRAPDGITFQAVFPDVLPSAVRAPDTRPLIIEPTTYKTVQSAQAVADKVSGEVIRRADDEYVVRRQSEGNFIRDPRGEVLTFRTERAAQKFVQSVRKEVLPEGSIIVARGDAFAVAHGMTPDEATRVESVPKGVDTRAPTILPDAEAKLDKAIKGVAAYKRMSQDLAKDAKAADTPPPRTAIDLDERGAPDEISEAAEQIEAYKAQIDLEDEVVKAQLDEQLKAVAIHEQNKMTAVEVATECVMKNG